MARKFKKEVIELNPEHISNYSLIMKKNSFYSLFNKLLDTFRRRRRAMYEKGRDFLEFQGYNQYEISNYEDNKNVFIIKFIVM